MYTFPSTKSKALVLSVLRRLMKVQLRLSLWPVEVGSSHLRKAPVSRAESKESELGP